LCATQSGVAVSRVVNEVTNPSTVAVSDYGDDVVGSLEPPSGSHVSVAKVVAEISGILPSSEGKGSGNVAGVGATASDSIKVVTTTDVAKTSIVAISSTIDASGGDVQGGEKMNPHGGRW
jgi:hypothetical protein